MAARRSVERALAVGEGDQDGTVELVVFDTSLLATVTATGAIVRDLTVDPDGVDPVVGASADAETREIADRVRQAFPEADLLARRNRALLSINRNDVSGIFLS